jgi:hypothetical protein
LGLHRRQPGDGTAFVDVCWRMASDEWPEMRWLADLSEDDRASYWARHAARSAPRRWRQPTRRRESRDADSRLSEPARESPGVEIFVDREEAYLAWVDAHPRGFVLNATRNPMPNYLQLHGAWCSYVSSRHREPGAYTERGYIKICAEDRQALETWAEITTGGQVAWPCYCRAAS